MPSVIIFYEEHQELFFQYNNGNLVEYNLHTYCLCPQGFGKVYVKQDLCYKVTAQTGSIFYDCSFSL